MSPEQRPRIVMLTPVAPRPAGNGLAMRQWLFLLGALTVADVDLVVVPVWTTDESAHLPVVPGIRSATVLRAPRRGSGLLVRGLRTASSARASIVERLAGVDGADAVLSMRLGLAPVGVALARRLGVPLIVDADDDEEAFFRSMGSPAVAAAAGRIAAECLPGAALVTTANAADALALTSRHDLGDRVRPVPNAVCLPELDMPEAPGDRRIVFIGTLTYPPNLEAARWLVNEVSPLIARPHRIDLVGLAGRKVRALASDHVVVHGAVPDVWPYYRDAGVVVAPLLSGSGTRIKIMEAFAHRRPVVSTTKGAEGIAVENGRHLDLADSPQDFAAAIEGVFAGESREAMLDVAYQFVAREHEIGATAVRIGELLRPTIGRR
jgi:glycosyltransferase involved in cell wall biosynthesis